LVVIEDSPNDDALSPQGEQAIDEELSPGALLDTDGDGFEKKNKKEKKHKKEKKEKKRKKSDIVEAEEHGREMPSPDEPKNGADVGNGEMGEADPFMDQTGGLAPEDIEEIALRGRDQFSDSHNPSDPRPHCDYASEAQSNWVRAMISTSLRETETR